MKHVLLFYEVTPDYLDRRAEHRSAHLAHAWAAHERGEILLAGALADPRVARRCCLRRKQRRGRDLRPGGSYIANGLVARWHVREWTTMVGNLAATPVRPADA